MIKLANRPVCLGLISPYTTELSSKILENIFLCAFNFQNLKLNVYDVTIYLKFKIYTKNVKFTQATSIYFFAIKKRENRQKTDSHKNDIGFLCR